MFHFVNSDHFIRITNFKFCWSDFALLSEVGLRSGRGWLCPHRMSVVQFFSFSLSATVQSLLHVQYSAVFARTLTALLPRLADGRWGQYSKFVKFDFVLYNNNNNNNAWVSARRYSKLSYFKAVVSTKTATFDIILWLTRCSICHIRRSQLLFKKISL